MHPDRLLLDLYSCPAQPGRWSQVLDRLCDETGACSAVVQAFRFDGDGVRLHWQAMDRRTAGHQALPQARYAATENPRLSRHRGLRGLNRVVRDEELFDRDDPARDALQRKLAGIGIGRFIGTLQPLDGDVYLGIALHRSVDDGRDFDRAAAARLEGLAPHLRQACEIGRLLSAGTNRLRALQTQLDNLRCGLLLCDDEARVRWMNRSAQGLVGVSPALTVHAGLLRAGNAAASAALCTEIACAGEHTRFVSLGEGQEALHLALRAAPVLHKDDDEDGERSVLIAVTRAGDALGVPVAAWSRLLGVTGAEAALVATLVDGGTVEQHAQRRGISAGTVRCQLKQVLAKTGTHRQSALVRLALSSAAAHVLDSVPAVPN